MKRFRLEYTADPRDNEHFESYAKLLSRAHDLIHAGKPHVRVFDSGMLLGVLTHEDFRGRCPKCDPSLAASLA